MHECIANGYSSLIGGVDMDWMWWNRRMAKRIKIVTNPWLAFGWSGSCDGKERGYGGEKEEIGVLEFYKP